MEHFTAAWQTTNRRRHGAASQGVVEKSAPAKMQATRSLDPQTILKPAIPRRSRVHGGPLLAALGLALLISGCSKNREVEASSPATPSIPTVAVAKATRQDMSNQMVLTAEFRPFQEVDVMAKVAGYVKEIKVDVGDRVQQGQLLAVLEVPEMADDIARGKASVDRSQAEVGRARDELQRAESSHQIAHLSYSRIADVAKQRAGLVAQQEVDDAHSKDLVAEAQVAASKSALAAAEEQVRVATAELKRVQTMMEYTKVIAPFTGVVTKRYADRKSTRLNSSHTDISRMPSSA